MLILWDDSSCTYHDIHIREKQRIWKFTLNGKIAVGVTMKKCTELILNRKKIAILTMCVVWDLDLKDKLVLTSQRK